jgi:RNA polymerase sigma-70 factor, ECF subfamily
MRDDDRAESEPVSLEQLIARDGELVARMLRRAGVLEGSLDDAVQQVFLVAARRLAAVRPGAGRAFLLGVALNVAAHARRRVARRREVDEEGTEEPWDLAPLPDDALDAARLGAVVSKLLDALPADLRVVLLLVDVEEHTMAQVADLLAIPRGTVASRLRRARAELAAGVGRVRPSRRMRAARATTT